MDKMENDLIEKLNENELCIMMLLDEQCFSDQDEFLKLLERSSEKLNYITREYDFMSYGNPK